MHSHKAAWMTRLKRPSRWKRSTHGRARWRNLFGLPNMLGHTYAHEYAHCCLKTLLKWRSCWKWYAHSRAQRRNLIGFQFNSQYHTRINAHLIHSHAHAHFIYTCARTHTLLVHSLAHSHTCTRTRTHTQTTPGITFITAISNFDLLLRSDV